MLGQMQRRVMGLKRQQDEETDPGTPTYPVGRRNAVRIMGSGYIFFRTDGTRRATFNIPAIPGGSIPAETGRVAARTWFLFSDVTSAFFTADYLSPAANVRVPSAAEDPDNNFRRVYDQTIESMLVEVRGGAIIAKTSTGKQTFLVGARQTTPGPNDTYTRKSQTGVKALTAIVIGGQVIWGEAQAAGDVDQGIANYPATAVTGTVGEFTIYNRYAGGNRAGDTLVVNAPQVGIISAAGGVFVDLGRPATEAEAAVNVERTF